MSNLKKNFIFNLLLTIFNILFPVVTFKYVSSILAPEGIGNSQFIITFAQFFVLIASLGTPIYGIRIISLAKDNSDKLNRAFSELLLINLISGFIITISYLIIVFNVPKCQSNIELYLIAGSIILFNFTSIDWFFQGLENFKLIAIRSIIIKTIALIGVFTLVTTSADLWKYVSLTIFSILGNNIWNIVSLKGKATLTFKSLELKKHITPILLIFSTSLSISIYTMMDTIILGLLSNNVAVGLYTAAIKLNKISIPVITAAGTILIPRIAILLKEGDEINFKKIINQSLSYVLLLGIPICAATYILAPELINLLSDDKFLPASTSMQILAPMAFVIGLSNVFGIQMLIPASKDKLMLYSVLFGTVASLLLNILLIPHWHEKGAAIATIISEVIVTVVSYYFVKKEFNFTFNWKELFASIISCLPFFVIHHLLANYDLNIIISIILNISISSIIYLLIQHFVFRNTVLLLIIETILIKTGYAKQ